MELLRELFMTAFVALVFSFLVAKLISIAMAASDDHVKSSKKGDNEIVKLDRGLKVKGSKSKKRVRFAAEEVVKRVDQFRGEEGSVSELEESVEESCGSKGGKLETCLEEEMGEESVKEGNLVNTALDQLIVEEKIQSDVADDADEMGGELGSDDGDQSGEVVRVLEELVVEERSEGSGMEGKIVNTASDELIVAEKNENEEADDEKNVGLVSDDVVGDRSGGGRVLEERSESSVKEGNIVNADLNELLVEEKSENEEANDDESVGLVSDDVVGDESGEVRVLKELVVEERIESSVKEGNRVINPLDELLYEEKIENKEADADKNVGLVSNYAVGDQSGEARVLKELVVEERSENSVKEGDIVNATLDELIVENKIENVEADDEIGVKLDSENVVGDQSGEVRVKEDQGSGSGGQLNEGNGEGEGIVSYEDDDWEGIERSELEKVFVTAASYVDCGGKGDRLWNLGSDVQMQLYGLHKVAMEGPCYEAQPMALKVSARAKWNAWQRLGNMSPEVAMEQYVSLLSDKDPGWMQGHSAVDGKPDSSEVAKPGVPETNIRTFLDKQTKSMQ